MSKRKSTAEKSQPAAKSTTAESTTESLQELPIAMSVADAARQRMIAEAAYYIAEKRGFAPGNELDDWFAAEAELTSSALHREPAAAELH